MTVTTGTGLPIHRWVGRLIDAPEIASPVEDACRVLVVAAHPDDETLGLGGAIQRMLFQGCVLRMVVATDGEAAYGSGPARTGLAATRRAELARAMAVLGVPDPVVAPGLPDRALPAHVPALVAQLEDGDAPDVVIAPWADDPHPDHRAAAAAAARYADRVGAPLWQYPIWMRHWTEPDDPIVLRDRLRLLRLSGAEAQRKAAAIACHTSQVAVFDGREPVLPSYVLAHFADGLEPLFAPADR